MKHQDERIREAVRRFWAARKHQAERQGTTTGRRDTGARSAVTGGAQMDGFVLLIRDQLVEQGVPPSAIFFQQRVELPGYFRPEKKWDLVVVLGDQLLAAVECKSQIGPSFGNNYNNRTEEALGSATDIWTAYREGAFKPSARPWLGYLMLLEDSERTRSPIAAREPHFPILPEFRDASYARRYDILLNKLLRERLYDATCFLLTDPVEGPRGGYSEPNPELGFRPFISGLLARAAAAGSRA